MLTFIQTSECFLSNGTNYMHILVSGSGQQAVYFGHVSQAEMETNIPYSEEILMGKRTQTLDRGTLPRRPKSRSRLFAVDVETGVLWIVFNEAAS